MKTENGKTKDIRPLMKRELRTVKFIEFIEIIEFLKTDKNQNTLIKHLFNSTA